MRERKITGKREFVAFFFFFHILSLDLFIVLLAKLPCRLETTSLTIFQGISGNS